MHGKIETGPFFFIFYFYFFRGGGGGGGLSHTNEYISLYKALKIKKKKEEEA